MKQKQHHGPTRAPHGKPEHDVRVGARVPAHLHRKFMRRGGSAWLRELIAKAP